MGTLASNEERRARGVEALLAGDPVDVSEFGYDFGGGHLGVVARGPQAREALRALVGALDARLFQVRRPEGTLWAWLGTRRSSDAPGLSDLLGSLCPEEAIVALGEPANGLVGWRRTHREAKRAFCTAVRCSLSFARYSNFALHSAVLQDEVLAASFRDLHRELVSVKGYKGDALISTLRAYIASRFNAESAASRLNIDRHTVSNHVQKIEETLGQPIEARIADLSVVLRLEELGWPGD